MVSNSHRTRPATTVPRHLTPQVTPKDISTNHGRDLVKHLYTCSAIRIRSHHQDDVPTGEPWIYSSLLLRLGPSITTIRVTRALWISHQGHNFHTHPLGLMLLHCPQLRPLHVSSIEETYINHNSPPNPALSQPSGTWHRKIERVCDH